MNNNNIDRIIYKNILEKKSINNLIKIGLDYSFLLKKYEEILINKEAIINENDFVLTDLGQVKLETLEHELYGNKLIEPLVGYKIEKKNKEEVFLPKYRPIA